MSIKVFENQTSNIESDVYLFEGGRLDVVISGTLDGADVKTVFLGANNAETILRTCSVMTSLSETLLQDAGGGYEFLGKENIKFIIENAGASTDVSLNFSRYPVN